MTCICWIVSEDKGDVTDMQLTDLSAGCASDSTKLVMRNGCAILHCVSHTVCNTRFALCRSLFADYFFLGSLQHARGCVYYCLWLIFVLVGSLSIMNVLIGILCEVKCGPTEQAVVS